MILFCIDKILKNEIGFRGATFKQQFMTELIVNNFDVLIKMDPSPDVSQALALMLLR